MQFNSVRPRFVAGLLFAGLLAAWLFHAIAGHPAVAAKAEAVREVPVDVATAAAADVPVYAEGLGTVQAFYTATVTARVDGQLERVAFIEGQEVKKGDLLAQIDARPYQAAYDQALATGAKDAALLDNARRDLARYELLAPDDLASKQTVDTQRSLVAQLDAQVKADRAAADSARTQLDYTTITAPIAGRTGIRLVDPGNNVHASDANGIVVVTQVQPISIVFSLPEDALPEVTGALGRGAVTAVALSRDRHVELDRGTVALVDNEIDQTTGTIRVKATFPNSHHALWPGQFVNVRVQTQVHRQALVIPSSAVMRGPNGVYTYRVKADSTVEVAPLKLGVEWADNVVAEQGLAAGDRVVASNQYRLEPGVRIRPNEPAVPGKGGKGGKP
jgi:multidrug efflux system membrane fusion protein